MDITSYLLGKNASGGGGGDTPTIGYVVNSFNQNGYPTEITTYGYTTFPQYFFKYLNSNVTKVYQYLTKVSLNEGLTNTGDYVFDGCSNLSSVIFPTTLEILGVGVFSGCTNLALTSLPNTIKRLYNYSFNNCTKLALTSLPSGLIQISNGVFSNCSNLALTTIPDGVTQLLNSVFAGCTKLKKMSMNNVTTINGSSTSNGAFQNCTGLKQVWIGSAITNNSFYRYSFNGCSNLEKMYINLPRATVESFTNYQYAFMNDTSKTGIIVCNDDEGFISKAEFDALVIE